MDLLQIKSFLTVADSLNFTTAADQLHLSQSTLSRQISAMESEWNILLFFRNNRNVALTPSGRYLHRELGMLYQQYMDKIENAQNIFKGYAGTLSIGVLEEVTLEGQSQKALSRYHEKYSNQLIEMKRGSFSDLTKGISDGSYDLIITLFFDISSHTSLRYKKLEQVQDGILISACNPLAQKEYFDLKDFSSETMIVLSQEDSSFASSGARNMCRDDLIFPIIKVAPNLDTAMLWVEAGLGFAFTYGNSVAAHNPSMRFIPFPAEKKIPESMLVLAWNPENQNPGIQKLISCYE